MATLKEGIDLSLELTRVGKFFSEDVETILADPQSDRLHKLKEVSEKLKKFIGSMNVTKEKIDDILSNGSKN